MLLIFSVLKGQYPFETHSSIVCKEWKNWITYDSLDKEHKLIHLLTIPNFFDKKEFTIKLTLFDTLHYSIIGIYRNNIEIQELIEPNPFWGITNPLSVYEADFNSDSLQDVKLLIPSYGNGGYNYYARVIYLLQKPDGGLSKISFTDLFMNFQNRIERDFDGDGLFEVITQTFQNYEKHNYWLFNLYNFKNDSLVNVNSKGNYPIMIQLLFRNNYEITNNISRERMKQFAKKLPDDYGIQ